MQTLYKLTNELDQTYGGCQWGENITIKTSGKGELCGPGFTHWYTDPLLAVLLNPIHADFDLKTAHLWEGEGDVIKSDKGLKVGCKKATTIKRITLPRITTQQSVAFAILCTLEIYKEESFVKWARNWLSGKDRSVEAASEATAEATVRAADTVDIADKAARAADTAEAAARAARAAAEATVWTARAAAEAARAVAEATSAAEAARAARAARAATETAAWAVAEAAAVHQLVSTDLSNIAKQALNY